MKKLILVLTIFLLGCSGLVIEKVSPNKTLRTPVIKKEKLKQKNTDNKSGEKEDVYKIDNFEDGDIYTDLGIEWYKWNDQDNGGGSKVKLITGKSSLEGFESEKSFTIDFELNKKDWKYDPYVGVGVFVVKGQKPLDASKYLGLRYSYKGAAHRVQLETADLKDYDAHGKSIKESNDWKLVEIPWAKFKQNGWGKQINFDEKKLKKFSINIAGKDGTKSQLSIDNVEFYTIPKIIIEVKNDLKALPLEDPKIEIGDITISNPLQKKAMTYLDKGANISNWLEADEYNYSMKYNEGDVKLMSEIGFKSLRVPINIDFFLKNRTSYFSSQSKPKFQSDLFMIIDKFAKWTKKYKMSLTIDHHQYKRSLNAKTQNDPNYASQLGKMEKQVVKHIASLNRDDIFFELYNEPDDKINAKSWHKIAQTVIDSITSGDTTVTLIVGSEYWYNLSHLIEMEPFKAKNIIYAFHFYDPFVFTHQGASWVDGLASIENVPYPYNENKWSTNSEHYGIFDDTPSWLSDQIVNYYKVSGKNYIKSQLLKAKKWGVENNVAVICNEFGALKKGTTQKDRANYLKMMRENFEELQIPWQHWEWKRGLGVVEENDKKDWILQSGLKEAFGF